MSEATLNILGCGSAMPTLRHLPSCQVIDYRGSLMMIDCGEGAQLQMRRMGLSYSRLRHIFISHLHGDHVLGLPGLLSTMAMHDVSGGVNIYTFADGIEIIDRMLSFFCRERLFDIHYHELSPNGGECILDTSSLTVDTFALAHRVPAVGFAFVQKTRPRHLRKDMIEFFNVPVSERHAIALGADFVRPDGTIIENARLTTDPTPAWSYAYCCDTAFEEGIARNIPYGIGTLYHDATYIAEMEDKAALRGHSTAAQAARMAVLCGAERLILGHYSKRFTDEQPLLDEARAIFPNTLLANEGMKLSL